MHYHELCDIVEEQLDDATKKLRAAGNKISGTDAEYLDKLTHIVKSLKAIENMDGASYGAHAYRRSYDRSYENSYDRSYDRSYDGSYDNSGDGSYARGRRYAKRDSMGRYSTEPGYSRAGLADKFREVIEMTDDPQLKSEMERMYDKIETMHG